MIRRIVELLPNGCRAYLRARREHLKRRSAQGYHYLRAHLHWFFRFSTLTRGLLHNDKVTPAMVVASSCGKQFAHESNSLETYFYSHSEGRGIWKWKHYFQIYQRHFQKFVGQDVHVLEIGVYSGGSLEMWQSYFGPQSRIYGVDIEEACKAYETETVKIFIGDQADREFWRRFKIEVPHLDIIIDDGGHKPNQQMATLEELLFHLRPGGIYLCEDIEGTFNQFADYVSGLSHNLNTTVWSTRGSSCIPTLFQSIIHSVHLYPFVVVIERADYPVSEFVSTKQGTQWQPFL